MGSWEFERKILKQVISHREWLRNTVEFNNKLPPPQAQGPQTRNAKDSQMNRAAECKTSW